MMPLCLSSVFKAGRLCYRIHLTRFTTTSNPVFHSFNEMPEKNEPFSRIPGFSPITTDDNELIFKSLENGSKIFIHGGATTPTMLLQKLFDYVTAKQLQNIQLYHLFTLGPYPFFEPSAKGCFSSRSLFVGHNCRDAVSRGEADFYPVFLSEVPLLFRRKLIEFDMALISVAPPNAHGSASLGTSVDITRSAIQHSAEVVAQLNKNVPFSIGEANVHTSHIKYMVPGDMPLHRQAAPTPTIEEIKIGKLISENLVDDGATIEAGIGGIPQSVLAQLGQHRELGVHTEMFSDSMVDLVALGAVTNAHKNMRPGKIVTSFVVGTEKVFKFVDRNPFVDLCDISWVASPVIIAQNPKPVCINTCLTLDITGQAAADSIGDRIYSGVGGLVDFIRGAAISSDGLGRAIIGMTTRSKSGRPTILPSLPLGSGVVLTRAHVHYVVTEYGIAQLFGRNLRQRAHALINIAHPDDRESLEKAAFSKLKVMPSAD